ncbi:MAG: dephospho-CoA kinase [Actinobacteria bacterium]|nr:dephospho-CoA kinase [Actinomycetota bacterium]
MARPLAVAITGGIGAGKSEALAAFARHGAEVISSDDIVHRLLAEDDGVRDALRERFGDQVLDDAGRPDRTAIAEVVFADREALAWLEALLHPLVVREYLAWRDELAARPDPPAVCATEVPLLYEVGGETRFDAVVVVTAPSDLRSARASVPLEARERRLLPDEEKVERADFAYVNDRALADLDAFVEGVLKELERRYAGSSGVGGAGLRPALADAGEGFAE